jgi:hypothetical protein
MAGIKTLRGADIQVYINGQPFGVATGVRWQADKGLHSIMGIDQYTAFELAPGAQSIKGTVECLRQRADGGLQGRAVSAPEAQVMLEKYISLALVDRSTDTVILAIEQALVGNESWQVTSKGFLSGSFSFEGLGWTNETT